MAEEDVGINSPVGQLALAALDGDADGAARMLAKSPDLGRRGGAHQLTALMLAAQQGKTEMVEILLSASDPMAVNRWGENALMLAAARGNADCVKLLIPHSDAGAQAARRGHTALMFAANHGQLECAKLLLPASDARAVDAAGKTALQMARDKGWWEGVDWLADHLGFSRRSELLRAAKEAGTDESLPRQSAMHEREAINRAIEANPAEPALGAASIRADNAKRRPKANRRRL